MTEATMQPAQPTGQVLSYQDLLDELPLLAQGIRASGDYLTNVHKAIKDHTGVGQPWDPAAIAVAIEHLRVLHDATRQTIATLRLNQPSPPPVTLEQG
jgi:hypothetical protein